ncbi:MAG: hypothetical protein AAFZ67_10865 [Planctomycetota bacterium]
MNDIGLWPRQVIDTAARREFATLLREFARGAITNTQYEDASDELVDRDTAIFAIHSQFIWWLYDDIFTHRLTGRHALCRESRAGLARAVLFLYTAAPADAWDDVKINKRTLLTLAAFLATIPIWPIVAATMWLCHVVRKLGCPAISQRREVRNDVWPFLCQQDYDKARSNPTLFAGR